MEWLGFLVKLTSSRLGFQIRRTELTIFMRVLRELSEMTQESGHLLTLVSVINEGYSLMVLTHWPLLLVTKFSFFMSWLRYPLVQEAFVSY